MPKREDYIGKQKRAAQNQAEKDNLIFRLVSVDGENFLGYPDDKRDDRVCCEVTNDRITEAKFQ